MEPVVVRPLAVVTESELVRPEISDAIGTTATDSTEERVSLASRRKVPRNVTRQSPSATQAVAYRQVAGRPRMHSSTPTVARPIRAPCQMK